MQAHARKRLLSAAASALLGLALLVLLASGRMLYDGKQAFGAGRQALGSGEREVAVSAFESAAKAYVPGSPYPRLALTELTIMAKAAEMRGERADARHIFEVIRRAALSSRHLVQPFGEELGAAEQALSRLALADRTSPGSVSQLVQRPADPNPLLSLLLCAGLLAWIGGASWLLWLTGHEHTDERKRALRLAALLSGCGLVVWLALACVA